MRDVGVRRRQYDWRRRAGDPHVRCGLATAVRRRHQHAAQLRARQRGGRRRPRTAAVQRRRRPPNARHPLCVWRNADREPLPAHVQRGPDHRAATSWIAIRPTTAWPGCRSASWNRPTGGRCWTIGVGFRLRQLEPLSGKRRPRGGSRAISAAACGSPIISGRSAARTACCRWRTSASPTCGSITRPIATSGTASVRSTCTPRRCTATRWRRWPRRWASRRAEQAAAAATSCSCADVARFWSRERSGVFLDNLPWLAEDKTPRMSDRALATAILFDQCPGGDTAAALRALVETPPEMGLSYPCNAGWRYWALARLGRADVSCAISARVGPRCAPSPKTTRCKRCGACEPDGGSQWSHCRLAPIFVLYQDIVGLRPLGARLCAVADSAAARAICPTLR